MWPVVCGFISPSQSDRLMYLAQQLLDQSVPVLLQVKLRSEIQVNGGPCHQKTEDMKLSPRVGREQLQQHSSGCHKRRWDPLVPCAPGLAGLREKPPLLVFFVSWLWLLAFQHILERNFPWKAFSHSPSGKLFMSLVLGP